jgi:hypothetical protein
MIRPRYWLTAAAAVCLLWTVAYTVHAVAAAT